MNAAAFVLGLGMGLRHAADSDHVAAILNLVDQRGSSVPQALRVAALWGLGHSVTLTGLGAVLVITGLQPPPLAEQLAELMVGLSLILLGAVQLGARPEKPTLAGTGRPVFVGLLHGLAGSGGVTLLAVGSLSNGAGAIAFLLVFSAGTVLGMMGVTLALSLPLRRIGRSPPAVRTGVRLGAAWMGVALGLFMLARTLWPTA